MHAQTPRTHHLSTAGLFEPEPLAVLIDNEELNLAAEAHGGGMRLVESIDVMSKDGGEFGYIQLYQLGQPAAHQPVTSVNVVEFRGVAEAATAQAALGGSCRVSLLEFGFSSSARASTPM
jgi:hypothetical protein